MQSAGFKVTLLVLAVSPWLSEAAGAGKVAAYSARNAKSGQRIVGCPLADTGAGIAGVAATKSMQGCAALCRARAPDCAAFAFSGAKAKCELSSGAPGAGACALSPAEGWTAFNLADFREPSTTVGVCEGSANACLNDGVCLSRTEQTDDSFVCAPARPATPATGARLPPTWSTWSNYSACSSTCGQGVRKRSRSCLDASGNPVAAVAACGSDSPDAFEACSSSVCPSWSPWSEWSVCNTTSTCGPGVRQRTRTCANGGVIGTRLSRQTPWKALPATPCPALVSSKKSVCLRDENIKDERWNSQFPITINHSAVQGAPVSLNPVTFEVMTLGKGYVQIYSDLLDKTGYVCSDGFDNDKEGAVVCRSLGFDGVQELPATSSLPAMPDSPLYLLSKLECTGAEGTLQSCPHSPWSNSTTCDSGRAAYVLWQRNRNRTCTNPRPLGGLNCDGDGFQEAPCPGLSPCPVDGSWTQWSAWQTCSALCGGGTKTRQRNCTAPQFGGAD
uniref:SRCR domain-containing protein n=1 Tax=Macrostomum lignano TaxID=282301 RepID=A0A1I8IIC6_9PLAT